MRTAFASTTVVLMLAACSGERVGESARTVPASSEVTTAAGTAPQGGTSTQMGALPDVARLGSLRKIRAMETRFSDLRPKLEDGVRAVSGIVSEVRCWTEPGWPRLEKAMGLKPGTLGGLSDPFTYEIHLPWFVCANLDALLAGERPESGDYALGAAASLVTLTHEGTHFTAAGSNEAVVECRAMQNADKVGAALGIEADYVQRLSRLYWEKLYPKDDPIYGSRECRDGGGMDVNSANHTWP
jgi:hypothetical protein